MIGQKGRWDPFKDTRIAVGTGWETLQEWNVRRVRKHLDSKAFIRA